MASDWLVALFNKPGLLCVTEVSSPKHNLFMLCFIMVIYIV